MLISIASVKLISDSNAFWTIGFIVYEVDALIESWIRGWISGMNFSVQTLKEFTNCWKYGIADSC